MHINLLCSDRHLPQDIWAKSNEGKWGGVDRGALILLKHQIIPFFSVGDFDSVSKEERQLLTEQLQIKPVQAEKADTDLALAVDKAIEAGSVTPNPGTISFFNIFIIIFSSIISLQI